MKIAIMVEGSTEKAFIPHLRRFLELKLKGKMPKLDVFVCNGPIHSREKLRRTVEDLLNKGKPPADAVIALTDVYTGKHNFEDAADAKKQMTQWVGPNSRFHPHAAQYDFEAWLLPYWPAIEKLAGFNRQSPGSPEKVNHSRPPSVHIKELFALGKRRDYNKPRDANSILKDKDLAVAAAGCPELRDLLNTILKLSGGELI